MMIMSIAFIALTCIFGLVGVRDGGGGPAVSTTSPLCEYTFTYVAPAAAAAAAAAVGNGNNGMYVYVEPVSSFASLESFTAGTALATNVTSSSLLLLAPRSHPLPARPHQYGRFDVARVCIPPPNPKRSKWATAAGVLALFSWNNNNTTSSAHLPFEENAIDMIIIEEDVRCRLVLFFELLCSFVVFVSWLAFIGSKLRTWYLLLLYTYRSLDLADLERHALLGQGSFGQVQLVSEKLRNDTSIRAYALKIQSLQNTFQFKIRHEIKVMQTLCHPFIVKLVEHFQDENNFYFLMPMLQGGEFTDRLRRRDAGDGSAGGSAAGKTWRQGLPEADARFYAFCIADALAYMHSQNCVHRDLKPSNIMIDSEGYPVLVNFGISMFVQQGKKIYAASGTRNYMAPEVLDKVGHDCMADLWSFGAVVYELITGVPLSYALLDGDRFSRLLRTASKEAIDLLKKLLQVDPSKRVSAQECLAHPWFDGLDVVSLRRRKFANVPWVPNIMVLWIRRTFPTLETCKSTTRSE